MKKFLIIFVSLIILLVVGVVVFYKLNLKAVSSSSAEVEFTVPKGSTYYTVIPKLKSEGLIRNELCFKIYIKLNKPNELQAGTYKLNKNMSVKEIIDVFDQGNNYNPDAIKITFKEGKHMRNIANVISENTNNSYDDVMNQLKDTNYLNELINTYWFIDNSILNSNIYYSLEGYLYPETYEFNNKDVTVKEIFKTMLNEMGKRLEPYKSDIENSKYSIHELLTLASVVELEGKVKEDRKDIAGVFYNRLKSNITLGSDVTTYYAAKKEMTEPLYKAEINDINAYNTRSSSMAGKLPVGPICNPSIESIEAVLKPSNNDYYYFVADKNGKAYFSKTYNEHLATINNLKNKGLWYEYE